MWRRKAWGPVAIVAGLAVMVGVVGLESFRDEPDGKDDRQRVAPGSYPGEGPIAGPDAAGRLGDRPGPGPLQQGMEAGRGSNKTVELVTESRMLGFKDRRTIEAKPGETINVVLRNASEKKLNYLHNFVLVNPGKEGQVAMDGPQKQFVPDSPDVLAKGAMIGPGSSTTIAFKAPGKTGEYPFICTFPGHSNEEHGTLKVG